MFTYTETDARDALAAYGDTEPHEIAHEIADGSGYVIYHNLAWELVTAATLDEVTRADEAVSDCDMLNGDTGLLDHARIVAYWIIYSRVLDMLEYVLACDDEQAG